MTDTTLFKFKDREVRTVMIDCEPWFVAADACRALGLAVSARGQVNVTMATASLSDTEVGFIQIETKHIVGTRRVKTKVVSESGLYKLVMRSDKPEAKDFQNWVTRVVLPAIRKDGGYIHGEEHVVSGAMTEDELVFKAMEVMNFRRCNRPV
ncbi:BRO-N domain-containing protein [Ensifer sp.]|jgi:prophage antirepressor-like protein|uniref:BRO-N domain-containing protein n=1 Tax=Ensifer sp. TaxID=1872086 RepID=UPI002E10C309|nr:BRO family protein [Ensifer sp.]